MVKKQFHLNYSFKFPWDTNKCDQFYSKTWVLSEEK